MKPQFGDVLIRGDVFNGYEVVDAVSLAPLSTVVNATLDAALVVARLRGGRIWRQDVDRSGRPLGVPMLLEPV
jgi:hypothetical protein